MKQTDDKFLRKVLMYIALKSKIWWQEVILSIRSGREWRRVLMNNFNFGRRADPVTDRHCSAEHDWMLAQWKTRLESAGGLLKFEIDVPFQIAVNLKDVEPTLVSNSDIIHFTFSESAAMLIVLWHPRMCVTDVDVLYSPVTQCLFLDSRSFSLRAE